MLSLDESELNLQPAYFKGLGMNIAIRAIVHAFFDPMRGFWRVQLLVRN